MFIATLFTTQMWKQPKCPSVDEWIKKMWHIYVYIYTHNAILWAIKKNSDSLWSHGLYPARLLCPWSFPGKNIGVSCHFFLQGIFLSQGSKLGLLHCRQILYCLSREAHKKELNLATCNNIDGTWGHYAKWVSQRKTITIWFHLHMKSKKQENQQNKAETDSQIQKQTGSCQRRGSWGCKKGD